MRLSRFILPWLVVGSIATLAQNATRENSFEETDDVALQHPIKGTVVITGARFCYPLIETWIEAYKQVNPNVKVMIAPRALTDPQAYDVLAEVYEQDENVRKTRAYLNVGRYAILPVTTTGSPLARAFHHTGLNEELIKQIFFQDIFARKNQKLNGIPFTVYTRLQKAGVPAQFSRYFGYEQKDLTGTAIAGADAHLLQAMLADSTGVTYLPLPLVYDPETRKPVDGVAILATDVNGNKKISDDERFYGDLDAVIANLEDKGVKDIRNIPISYFHLSVDKNHASAEALDFISWVHQYGEQHLHKFGFMLPEAKELNSGFREFATKQLSNQQ